MKSKKLVAIAMLLSLALSSFCVPVYAVEDAQPEAESLISVEDLISASGVQVREDDQIEVVSCTDDAVVQSSTYEVPAYVKITSCDGDLVTTTAIIPYTESDGIATAVPATDIVTYDGTGYIPINFRNVNIVVTVMGSYNVVQSADPTHISNGIYPLGVMAKWGLMNSSGTQNTVSSLSASFVVNGRLVNAKTFGVINSDYSCVSNFTKASPTKNVYYSGSCTLSSLYCVVPDGSARAGKSVSVSVVVGGVTYEDMISV